MTHTMRADCNCVSGAIAALTVNSDNCSSSTAISSSI